MYQFGFFRPSRNCSSKYIIYKKNPFILGSVKKCGREHSLKEKLRATLPHQSFRERLMQSSSLIQDVELLKVFGIHIVYGV